MSTGGGIPGSRSERPVRHGDIATALREISAVDPGALVFGTDLPGPRACRLFEKADADLIFETLGERTARRVIYSNAVELYSEEREKEERRG